MPIVHWIAAPPSRVKAAQSSAMAGVLEDARMQVNVGLFEVLHKMRAEAMVVVATDNMDRFARAIQV